MKTSYQYRLKPTKEQAEKIDKILDMLRCQYNYQLAQRFHWYEANRSPVDRCSIFVCHLPELKDKPNRFSQQASLTQLKEDRPWYKNIHSQVLQEVPKKVELAFDRWLKGDSNGKKSGFFGYFYGKPGSKSLKGLLCRRFIENMEIIVYNPCPVRVLLSPILNHHKRDARAKIW